MNTKSLCLALLFSVSLVIMYGCGGEDNTTVYMDDYVNTDTPTTGSLEDFISDNGSDNGTDGPDTSTMTGAELYDEFCETCHGPLSGPSLIPVVTADAFEHAIDVNAGGMDTANLQALTYEQLESIATAIIDAAP